MAKKTTLLLLVSLLLALATGGAAWYWLQGQKGVEQEKVALGELWVAKDTILSGTKISNEMLVKKEAPATEITDALLNKPEDIVGKYAKESILKGEGFPAARLYKEGEQFLSMKLEPGYRAFSITVTQFAAVADLIMPGDHVDVFIYLEEKAAAAEDQGQAKPNVRPEVAKVILQNMRVLGIRKQVSPSDEKPEQTPELYAVTLAVTVKEAEKLMLAEETGLLKLALRPYNDTGTVSSYGVVVNELLLEKDLKIRDMNPQYGIEHDLNRILTAPNVGTTSSTSPQASGISTPPSTDSSKAGNSSTPGSGTTDSASTTFKIYTVKPGDTLMSISRNFFNGEAGHYRDIMKANGMNDPTIKPGQKLKIPTNGR